MHGQTGIRPRTCSANAGHFAKGGHLACFASPGRKSTLNSVITLQEFATSTKQFVLCADPTAQFSAFICLSVGSCGADPSFVIL
jgi:hypothetical protein